MQAYRLTAITESGEHVLGDYYPKAFAHRVADRYRRDIAGYSTAFFAVRLVDDAMMVYLETPTKPQSK